MKLSDTFGPQNTQEKLCIVLGIHCGLSWVLKGITQVLKLEQSPLKKYFCKMPKIRVNWFFHKSKL